MRRWVCAAATVAVALVVSPVSSAATNALVMGSSGHPLSTPPDPLSYVQQYVSAALNNFITPAVGTGQYNAVALITPEENAPYYGTLPIAESIMQGIAVLDTCLSSAVCAYNPDIGSTAPSLTDSFVVYGYSQSAYIALAEKAALAAEYTIGEGPTISFVVTGNSTRPNGGLTTRTSPTSASSTDTQFATVDIAIQYDGIADAPLNNLNLLADLNAYMGLLLLHPTYVQHSLNDANVVDQGQYGDTHYYLITTPILPLLMPVESFGPLGHALADTLDPPLRVLVEAAYDRSVSPGQPTGWDTSYFPDPISAATDFMKAIPAGWDNGLEDTLGVRPFGTQRPGALPGQDSSPVQGSRTVAEQSAAASTPRPAAVGHSNRRPSATSATAPADTTAKSSRAGRNPATPTRPDATPDRQRVV